MEPASIASTALCFPCKRFVDGAIHERTWKRYHKLHKSGVKCGFCALVKASWNAFPAGLFWTPEPNSSITATYDKFVYGPSESLNIRTKYRILEVHVGPGKCPRR
jgi:hypothetical protein